MGKYQVRSAAFVLFALFNLQACDLDLNIGSNVKFDSGRNFSSPSPSASPSPSSKPKPTPSPSVTLKPRPKPSPSPTVAPSPSPSPTVTPVAEIADASCGSSQICASRGADKKMGSYVPTLYNTLTLRGSRGETMGMMVRAKLNSCDSIQITQPSNGATIKLYDLPKINMPIASADNATAGQNYDPVVPKTNSSICPDGGEQWLWAEFSVPQTASPGISAAKLRLANSGAELKLYIKVWPMLFSDARKYALQFYGILDADRLSNLWHWGAVSKTNIAPSYVASMVEHRMFPIQTLNWDLPIVQVDGESRFDLNHNSFKSIIIDKLPSWAFIDLRAYELPVSGDPSGKGGRDPSIQLGEQGFVDRYRAMENTVRAYGLKGRTLTYVWDEAGAEHASLLGQIASKIKSIAPDVRVAATSAPFSGNEPVDDLINVLNFVDNPVDDYGVVPPLSAYQQRRKTHDMMWWYIACGSHGCGGPYTTGAPDFVADKSLLHTRIFGFLSYKYQMDSTYYYYMNLAPDPWSSIYQYSGNGDGTFLYPARPGEHGFTQHGAVASLRMKAWREASFDAEYLRLLKESGPIPSWFNTRLAALVKNPVQWSLNYNEYQKLRDDVGEYLASGVITPPSPGPSPTPSPSQTQIPVDVPPTAVDGPNLLTNGDFSNGIKGWNDFGDPRVSQASDGTAQINPGPRDNARITQMLSVKPSTLYRVRFEFNTSQVTGNFQVKLLDPDQGWLGRLEQSLVYNSSQSWAPYDFVIASGNSSRLLLYLGNWGGSTGTAGFRNISVAEEVVSFNPNPGPSPSPTPTPPQSGNYYLYPSQFYSTLPINHFEQVADDRLVHTSLDGRDVYKFTVKHGDMQWWDSGNIGPGGEPNSRSELSFAPAPDGQKRNSPNIIHDNEGVQTYTVSYNFESGWPMDQRWVVLTQFHPTGNGWGASGLVIHGGNLEAGVPASSNGSTLFSIPIQTGKWYDFQWVVNWSTGKDGYEKFYLGGKLIASYSGPTAIPGEQYYIKQGYYRDGAIQGTGTVYETLIGVSSQAP